jgi:hypothetical protein
MGLFIFFMLEGYLLQSCYFNFGNDHMFLQVERVVNILKKKKKIGIQNIKQVEFISYEPQNQNLPRELKPNPNGSYPWQQEIGLQKNKTIVISLVKITKAYQLSINT